MALAVELYLFFSKYPNQLYSSYSEENPDSFTAGQTSNFFLLKFIGIFYCIFSAFKVVNTDDI